MLMKLRPEYAEKLGGDEINCENITALADRENVAIENMVDYSTVNWGADRFAFDDDGEHLIEAYINWDAADGPQVVVDYYDYCDLAVAILDSENIAAYQQGAVAWNKLSEKAHISDIYDWSDEFWPAGESAFLAPCDLEFPTVEPCPMTSVLLEKVREKLTEFGFLSAEHNILGSEA